MSLVVGVVSSLVTPVPVVHHAMDAVGVMGHAMNPAVNHVISNLVVKMLLVKRLPQQILVKELTQWILLQPFQLQYQFHLLWNNLQKSPSSQFKCQQRQFPPSLSLRKNLVHFQELGTFSSQLRNGAATMLCRDE